MTLLEARQLTKRYSSFTAGNGEVLGYLGPNGSGNSTTLKMITGLIAPRELTILQDKEKTRFSTTGGVAGPVVYEFRLAHN